MPGTSVHENHPVYTYGPALHDARVAVLMLHGRGSTAQSILGLATQLPQDATVYLAPQAAHQTWYPNSGFIAIEANEPYVSSAFQTVSNALAQITDAGIPPEKIVIGGFSQGACLAAEYVARHPKRYGGLFVLSGALLGPVESPRQYAGSLEGTPVFVGGGNADSWVTEQQLRLTGRVLQDLGAAVEIDIHSSAEHTVRPAEVARVHSLISALHQ